VVVGEGVAVCSAGGVWSLFGITAVLQADRSAARRRRVNSRFIVFRLKNGGKIRA
jgi:hypothetical protein